MVKEKKLQDFHHVRRADQLRKMKEIEKRGICHLCPKYLKTYHDAAIEREGKYCAVTKNDYPYAGTALHYMIIHRRHIEHISKISGQAWAELADHFKWLKRTSKLPGGGFFMRFGDSAYTGATALHLHAHVILGDRRKNKGTQKILNVPLGYEQAK